MELAVDNHGGTLGVDPNNTDLSNGEATRARPRAHGTLLCLHHDYLLLVHTLSLSQVPLECQVLHP
jgi:hypothetical protein